MTVRDVVAKGRPPLLHGGALVATCTLLGVLVGAVAIVLPSQEKRDYLVALSAGPGLSHALVAAGTAPASDVVHAEWGDRRAVAASWPAEAAKGKGERPVRIRAPLFVVTALWGLAVGLLTAVLWQSTALRKPIIGGFAVGAITGALLALLLPLAPAVAERVVVGLTQFEVFTEGSEVGQFAGRPTLSTFEARIGGHAALTTTWDLRTHEMRAAVTRVGVAALAILGGALGVGIALVGAGLCRLHRRVAIVPLGLGLGLSFALVLPFLPMRSDALLRLLVTPAEMLVSPLGNTWYGAVDAGVVVHLVAWCTLVAALVVVPTSFMARSRERALRAKLERRSAAEEAERERPVEPIPLSTDDRPRGEDWLGD